MPVETTTLYMTFKLAYDGKRTITVNNPVDNLTQQQVAEAMDNIIAADIFQNKLVAKDSARYVTRVVQDYEVS